MEFCHIAPVSCIDLVDTPNHTRHLTLAHLVETNPEYVKKYRSIKERNPNTTIIMDNSAFEMAKSNRPMFDSNKLIDLGHQIGADYIVLSDYPFEPWKKTVNVGFEMAEAVKSHGFKTFVVPQSAVGDMNGWMKSVEIFLIHPELFDLIGLSILACPIAHGLNEGCYGESVHGAYRMQRYLSRWNILTEMERRGLLANSNSIQRFHCLGMVEGPNEITLLKPFNKYITSWDTSSAVWHGLNNIMYDRTPTGLLNGKLETEVDFDYVGYSERQKCNIMHNIDYIDCLVEDFNTGL